LAALVIGRTETAPSLAVMTVPRQRFLIITSCASTELISAIDESVEQTTSMPAVLVRRQKLDNFDTSTQTFPSSARNPKNADFSHSVI
jgi:hypothetical protein